MAQPGPSQPYGENSQSSWGNEESYSRSHSSYINCEVVASHQDATVRIVKDVPRGSGYETPKAFDSHPNTPRRKNQFYSTFSTDSPRMGGGYEDEDRGRSLSPPPADRRSSRYSAGYSDYGRRPYDSDYSGRRDRDRDYDRSYHDDYSDRRSEAADDIRPAEDQYVRPPRDRRRSKKNKDKDAFSTHISKIVDGVIRGKWKDPYGLDDEHEGGPESYKDVVQTKWNIVGTIIFLYYVAASIFYFVYRAMYTLNMGIVWYGWLVLCVEMFTATSSLGYAVLLCKATRSRFTDGLPPARRNRQGQYEPVQDEKLKFHVRVLIPCYRETVELVRKTVLCALEAELPDDTRRTVYLCDDGNDPEKRDMIDEMALEGKDVAYITGRTRPDKSKGEKPEINGKSNNLNNALRNHIYKDVEDHTIIPNSECIVVFDADMCPNPNFYVKILEVMFDERVSLCLTPQDFHNVNLGADIFNNSNLSFWEYILPGCDAVGYIACTGTNFCIRANALCECGWFPDWTITEDYALGMELKKREKKAVYLNEYIAKGEAPEEIRNIFRQRSRWCKGQMQVLFSRHCPLFDTGLPFSMRLLYTSVTWCYITNIFAVPTGVLVPFVAIVIGYYPLVINFQFALASTLFFFANNFVVMYCTSIKHIKPMWFCSVSCHLLWFTFTKATTNVLIAKTGLKSTVFKATKKKGENEDKKKRNCCKPANMGDLEGTLDAYVLFFSFFLSFVTFLAGIYQIIDNPNTAQGDFRFYLLLSVCWAVYNMIPPALFIFYIHNKGRVFEEFCSFCLVTSFTLAILSISCLWLVPNDYDFGQVLGLALQFYEAQHVGKVNQANRHIWWRSDAFVNQTYQYNSQQGSITAGYFDNYGFVRMTYTTALSMVMLAWSKLEFPMGYSVSNNDVYVANTINHGIKYITQAIVYKGGISNSTSSEIIALVALVGDVEKDKAPAAWTRPETYKPTSGTGGKGLPVGFIDKTSPGTDVAAMSAAALAAASATGIGNQIQNMRWYNQSVALYMFAMSNKNVWSNNAKLAAQAGYMYMSYSYNDDLAFAAAWIFRACLNNYRRYNKQIQIQQCGVLYAQAVQHYTAWTANDNNPNLPDASALRRRTTLNPYVFNYENVGYAAAVLLYQQSKFLKRNTEAKFFRGHLDLFMNVWLGKNINKGRKWVSYTKRGMAFQNPAGQENIPYETFPYQGGMGNTMNAAYLALMYSKVGLSSTREDKQIRCWSRGQLGYALGDGGRSYVVGYKPNYPQQTPHKAASCQGIPTTDPYQMELNECTYDTAYQTSNPNPHIVYGALVGGPRRDDSFSDERDMDILRNPSVAATLLNNAGFTATLAGLRHWGINLAKCEQGHGLIQNIQRKVKGTSEGEIWGSW